MTNVFQVVRVGIKGSSYSQIYGSNKILAVYTTR